MKNNIKYVFPNAITIVNLILGCIAITVALIGENEYYAGWLIILAAIFDLFDGAVARLLNAKSELGIQLDSLADMVSFGVAPAIILYRLFYIVLINRSVYSTFEISSSNVLQSLVLLCAFAFTAAVAIRLAKFNIRKPQADSFKGLTSTSAALVIAAIWILFGYTESEAIRNILINIYFVFSVIILLIFLMLSNLSMISLKFKGIGFPDNYHRYIIIFVSVILIAVFNVGGFLLSMLFYILFSIVMGKLKLIN